MYEVPHYVALALLPAIAALAQAPAAGARAEHAGRGRSKMADRPTSARSTPTTTASSAGTSCRRMTGQGRRSRCVSADGRSNSRRSTPTRTASQPRRIQGRGDAPTVAPDAAVGAAALRHQQGRQGQRDRIPRPRARRFRPRRHQQGRHRHAPRSRRPARQAANRPMPSRARRARRFAGAHAA